MLLRKCYKRNIAADDVERAIAMGETITTYPNDKPFPSQLILYFVEGSRALHVVVSQDMITGICYIITTYEPDPDIWTTDFRKKHT